MQTDIETYLQDGHAAVLLVLHQSVLVRLNVRKPKQTNDAESLGIVHSKITMHWQMKDHFGQLLFCIQQDVEEQCGRQHS